MKQVQRMSPEFYPAIINGEKVATGKSFDDTNPSTGRVFAQFARCGQDEIDQAVEAAREASNWIWRETDAAENHSVLERWLILFSNPVYCVAGCWEASLWYIRHQLEY